MKVATLALAIALAALVAGCNHDMENKEAWEKLDRDAAAKRAQTNEHILETEIKIARIKFDDAAAKKFEACHRFPPPRSRTKRRVIALRRGSSAWKPTCHIDDL